MKKTMITVTIDQDLYERCQKFKNFNRSEFLNQALKEKLALLELEALTNGQ